MINYSVLNEEEKERLDVCLISADTELASILNRLSSLKEEIDHLEDRNELKSIIKAINGCKMMLSDMNTIIGAWEV